MKEEAGTYRGDNTKADGWRKEGRKRSDQKVEGNEAAILEKRPTCTRTRVRNYTDTAERELYRSKGLAASC